MIFEDDTYYTRYYIDNDGILVATLHGKPIVVSLGRPHLCVIFLTSIPAKARLHKHQNDHGNG